MNLIQLTLQACCSTKNNDCKCVISDNKCMQRLKKKYLYSLNSEQLTRVYVIELVAKGHHSTMMLAIIRIMRVDIHQKAHTD